METNDQFLNLKEDFERIDKQIMIIILRVNNFANIAHGVNSIKLDHFDNVLILNNFRVGKKKKKLKLFDSICYLTEIIFFYSKLN